MATDLRADGSALPPVSRPDALTAEEVQAVAAFYEYGATRGNHRELSAMSYGPPPGPLTPHIGPMGTALTKLRAALRDGPPGGRKFEVSYPYNTFDPNSDIPEVTDLDGLPVSARPPVSPPDMPTSFWNLLHEWRLAHREWETGGPNATRGKLDQIADRIRNAYVSRGTATP